MRALRPALALIWGLLPAVTLAACGGGDTLPSLTLSIALADGRTCRDAGATTLQIERGGATPLRWICFDAEAPRSVEATDLPLSDERSAYALSAEGAPLYRGRFVPAEAAAQATTPVILLYPDAAR